MRLLCKLVVSVLAIAIFTGVATSTALAQDPDNGKTLWEEQVWQCSQCHGPAGEGKFGRPLTNSTLTAVEWIAQVRTPRRFMPTFSDTQVTDEQITDMHAYINSLPEPTGEFARTDPGIPADAPEGQQLIAQKNCVACHGENGPINGFIERGEVPTADGVIAQLRTPFRAMPTFSTDQVSDAEATLIAEFMAEQVSSAETAPAALPQSGADHSAGLPLAYLLVAGGGLLLIGGLMARRAIIMRS